MRIWILKLEEQSSCFALAFLVYAYNSDMVEKSA